VPLLQALVSYTCMNSKYSEQILSYKELFVYLYTAYLAHARVVHVAMGKRVAFNYSSLSVTILT